MADTAVVAPGAPSYRESLPFVPPALAWLIFVFSVSISVAAVWDTQADGIDILDLAPLLAFLGIGLVAVLARVHVEVTGSELRVGNSPRLTRGIPLSEVQRVESRTQPPSRRQLNWPLVGTRSYALIPGPGVLVTLAGRERIYLDSQTPERLAAAIARAAPHVATGPEGSDGWR